jgi:hypothetical protein
MKNLVVLGALAEGCREGLKSLSGQSRSMFSGFPMGSCGPAAEIVGRILKEKAGYDGQYVCGRQHRRLKPSQTHAWYEVDDYIIDITHDQFDDVGLTGWVFRSGQGWHAEFADLDRRDGFSTPINWPDYPHDGYQAVIQELSKQAV